MKAIVKGDIGQASLVLNRPIPALKPGHILIKVAAVALNPIDWMKIDRFPAPGTILGCDYAGTVEAIGANVDPERFSKGDRVCGYIMGGNRLKPDEGAFAEYALAQADIQQHIPDDMSFEQAAALGASILTGFMGLFLRLGLKKPTATEPLPGQGQYVLIYGGSTASGAFAIQLAARIGYSVLTTCSPRNTAYVKSLGASHVVDYNDPDCAKQLRLLANDHLTYVLDTIAVPTSAKICAEAMAKGGRAVLLLPIEFPRQDVEAMFMDASQSLGEYYEYGPERMPVQVDEEAHAFAKSHIATVDRLLAQGELKPHAIEVCADGLGGILEGLDRLRQRKVSGKKLVYRVADTD